MFLLPLLCAPLAWWSSRRGERWTELGSVAGPLFIAASYGVLRPTAGDHYSAVDDLFFWLGVCVLGALVGGAAAALGRWRRRTAS